MGRGEVGIRSTAGGRDFKNLYTQLIRGRLGDLIKCPVVFRRVARARNLSGQLDDDSFIDLRGSDRSDPRHQRLGLRQRTRTHVDSDSRLARHDLSCRATVKDADVDDRILIEIGYLRLSLPDLPHEVFCCAFLDAQNRVIAFEELFRGTLTQTSVYPREVVKRAPHHNCGAIILAHNHPSGVCEPTLAAKQATTTIPIVMAAIGALGLVPDGDMWLDPLFVHHPAEHLGSTVGCVAHQAFRHAAAQDALEDVTKRIALPESTVAILGEGRAIRNLVFQPKAAEPTISQIQVNLFAEASFRANAETVPNDQHAHHQLGINRRPARVAIVLSKVLTQLTQVKKVINASKQMISRNVILKAKGIKQTLLIATLLTHHLEALHQCTARSDTSHKRRFRTQWSFSTE